MKTGAIASVLAALALAAPAQAHARHSLHERERHAIRSYTRSQDWTIKGCRIYGRRHRELRCHLVGAIYLQPSGVLLGYETAVICAFPRWDHVYLVMIRPPGLIEVTPTTPPTLTPQN